MQNVARDGKGTLVTRGSREKYASLPCAIKKRFINNGLAYPASTA